MPGHRGMAVGPAHSLQGEGPPGQRWGGTELPGATEAELRGPQWASGG